MATTKSKVGLVGVIAALVALSVGILVYCFRGSAQTTELSQRALVGPTAEVERILTSQPTLLNRILTIDLEYTVEETRLRSASPTALPPQYETGRFRLSGDKYRSEVVWTRSGREPVTSLVSYDRVKYQFMDEPGGMLGLSSTPPDLGYNSNLPFLRVYAGYFTSAADRTFASTRSNEAWANFIKASKVLADDRVNEHECAVVETNLGDKGMTRTYFARDAELFPVRYQLRNKSAHPLIELVVLRLDVTPTDHGMTYTPSRIEETWFDQKTAEPIRKLVFETKMNTLRINKPIPEDVFKIPPESAAHVEDMDAYAH